MDEVSRVRCLRQCDTGMLRAPLCGLILGCVWFGLGVFSWVEATPPSAEELQFFETKIRPVLVKHCYACHGPESAELGGKLRLDSREAVLRGGESGPALVAGKPAESLLLRALRQDGLEMPPDGPLSPAIVQDFEQWIQRGAVDPRDSSVVRGTGEEVNSSPSTDVILWSLQPITDPVIPAVQATAWPRDAIDRFVLSKIEAAGLEPTVDAAPQQWIQRLYIDLIGLPPTLAEMNAYVKDVEANGIEATERWVDDLLARPQFGERWGRHWLDVARYGESNGNDGLGRNPTFPHAWRYRDYVIRSLNEDLPIKEFFREQIAGDLLTSDSPELRDRRRVATGFLALTAKPAKAMNSNFDMDVVADQIDVIGRGMLGLSVTCARCHDHKFDPIPTRDYYALAGIFTSSETLWGVAANEGLTAPATDLHVLEAAPHVLPPADFVETVLVLDSNTGQPKKPPKPKWPLGTPLAMGVRDRAKVADCKIHIKGESGRLGASVSRGFLSCVSFSSAPHPLQVNPEQSGRRELADWVTHAEHPLTPRVFVNRVWQHLFGEGLVGTPDDFGVYGQPPTNPQLLDHLATRFVRQGWSLKQLIRTIVLTRTYQLSSDDDAASLQADAENRLLTRHSRRRLDAESLRDRMLFASDQLDLRPGSGSLIRHRDILVNRAGNLHEPSRQRSVYLCYLRSSPPPELAAFDLPDFTAVLGQRDSSVLASQALHLYNSPFVIEQSAALARRVLTQATHDAARVQLIFQSILIRDPSPSESTAALELVAQLAAELGASQPESDSPTLASASQPGIASTLNSNQTERAPNLASIELSKSDPAATNSVPEAKADGKVDAGSDASGTANPILNNQPADAIDQPQTTTTNRSTEWTPIQQAWAALCQAIFLTNEFRYED